MEPVALPTIFALTFKLADRVAPWWFMPTIPHTGCSQWKLDAGRRQPQRYI